LTSFKIIRVPIDKSENSIVELISPDILNESVLKMLEVCPIGDVLYVDHNISVGDCILFQNKGENSYIVEVNK